MVRTTVAPRHGSFPTTADMGIWARGPTDEALLEGLGKALLGAMTDPRKVRVVEERRVTVAQEDPAARAVAFLNELVLLFQTDGFLARRIAVRFEGPDRIVAELGGEPFDERRHPRRIEVKAATLHRALYDPAHRRARVILDI